MTCVRTEGTRIVAIGKELEPHDAYDTGVFAVGRRFFDVLADLEAPSLTEAVRVLAAEGAAHVDRLQRPRLDRRRRRRRARQSGRGGSGRQLRTGGVNVAAYVDRSRDRAVEDPTNLWVVHPLSRRLLPIAVNNGISANAVSIAGLCIGTGAALCYFGWTDWRLASLGFFLTIWWLVADGLDGMVARATGSASPMGRILDGICDHGVFALLYLALSLSIGTAEGWAIALLAAAFHAVQSSLYEAERIRYHRRLRGDPLPAPPLPTRNPLVRVL